MDSLRHQYESQLKDITSLNKQAISDKEKKWREEKSDLKNQLAFTQEQFEENRKMHK